MSDEKTASKSLSASFGAFFRRRASATPPVNKRKMTAPPLKTRSKSLEFSTEEESRERWSELVMVKTLGPVVLCLLPAVSCDFTSSSLLAVGATPELVTDATDIEQQLSDCKAVVLDVSAPKDLVEELIDKYTPMQCPLILLTCGVGICDRKKALARKVINECSPTVISGRMGDITALTMDVMDRAAGRLSDEDDEDTKCKDTLAIKKDASLPRNRSGTHSPVMPAGSPMLIRKKKNAIQRKGTVIPAVLKKGQFRDRSMKDITPQTALEMAVKLAAQSYSIVHLYETNTLTNGEVIHEINNSQFGMHKLHSTIQCAGCILAAVLACVDDQGTTVNIDHCGHGLSLYYVAAQEASTIASTNDDINPGTLRVKLIDMLSCLDETSVRCKANIAIHPI